MEDRGTRAFSEGPGFAAGNAPWAGGPQWRSEALPSCKKEQQLQFITERGRRPSQGLPRGEGALTKHRPDASPSASPREAWTASRSPQRAHRMSPPPSCEPGRAALNAEAGGLGPGRPGEVAPPCSQAGERLPEPRNTR